MQVNVDFDETDRSYPFHQGRDDKPAIMLIHGMWSHPGIWTNFRSVLEARGYRVIVPALRHHDGPLDDDALAALATTSLADYLADLTREIGMLDRKPLVIGHSMGGLLGHMLAARGLARAVVGLAPAQSAGAVNGDPRLFWTFRREFLAKKFWKRTQLPSLKAMRPNVLNGMSRAEGEALHASLRPESGRTLLEIGFWFLDRRRTTWINPADVACPMLFLTGTEDRLAPLWLTQRLAEPYGEQLKVEALPGRAHWLPSEPGWEGLAERSLAFFEKEASVMARRMAWSQAARIGSLVTAS